jgi:tetratricopeptide (TPR) repeat protein
MSKRFTLKSQIGTSVVVLLVLSVAGCGSPEERAEQYYKSGMMLIEKKDDVAARLELLKAVKYKSDRLDVWKALAEVDGRTRSSSLFLDLRRVVELDPRDLDARLQLARIMIGGGAVDAASKMLDAANDDDKPSAELHALRALALLRGNDSTGAIREAQRASEIDPTNFDAGVLLASRKVSGGDNDEALKILDRVSANPTDEVRLSQLKAQIYVKKGDLPKAESLIRKIVADRPQDQGPKTELIDLLIMQNKFDEAEKELRARIEANPSDSKAGLDLVRFLTTMKGTDAARAELETRIKAGGDNFDYQIALAQLNFEQKRFDEATQSLKKLADTAPSADRKLQAQVMLAEMHVNQGNTGAAEPLISDVLAKDRRNTGALRLRAALSLDKGQNDSAVTDLREALNDQPKSPDLLVMLAVAYERGGKPELADRQYADALKASNSNPNVALRYATFLQRKGDADHAEDMLTQALVRNPSNLQLLASLAQVRLRLQNWSGALAIADQLASNKSGQLLSNEIRAAALAGQNKVEESITALEEAHKAVPEAAQPVVALASAYVKQGRPEQATALLQDMNRRFPDNAQVLVLLGQTELAQKKDDDALSDFKEAIKKNPREPAGYGALSEFYIKNKNYDSADKILQASLKQIPDNANFRLLLANVQILKGDNDAAIAQYEGILKDEPKSLVAINNLVSLLLDNRSDKASLDRAEALSESLKAANLPQFQDTLGWAQYRKGDLNVAIATLEGALAKAPNLAALHYHLGMSYKAAGQAEKATEELQKALKLEPDGTALKANIRSAMN